MRRAWAGRVGARCRVFPVGQLCGSELSRPTKGYAQRAGMRVAEEASACASASVVRAVYPALHRFMEARSFKFNGHSAEANIDGTNEATYFASIFEINRTQYIS